MAYLPLNLFFAGLFILGIIWGWEGDEMRQFFAILSSIAMLPLWLSPLYNLIDGTSIVRISGWLPTFIFFWILWWNVTLMYFTVAHLFETLGREEPIGKALKRARKQR